MSNGQKYDPQIGINIARNGDELAFDNKVFFSIGLLFNQFRRIYLLSGGVEKLFVCDGKQRKSIKQFFLGSIDCENSQIICSKDQKYFRYFRRKS